MSRLVVELLREARHLVARPTNDFSWSSWRDASAALSELNELSKGVEAGRVSLDRVAVLFAPTGPLQEVAQASGWGDEFLALANRFDAALAAASHLRATFACSLCDEPAGTIELTARAGGAELRRETFTSTLLQPVLADGLEPLRTALAAADAPALFALDAEYAPFYCPTCAASYCGAHWDWWRVFDEDEPWWHDSVRGRCPQGHERMLED